MSDGPNNKPPSPLPWKFVPDSEEPKIQDAAGDSVMVGESYDQYVNTEDMPHIAHAINAYPGLVDALQIAVEVADLHPQHEKYAARWRVLLKSLGENAPPKDD